MQGSTRSGHSTSRRGRGSRRSWKRTVASSVAVGAWAFTPTTPAIPKALHRTGNASSADPDEVPRIKSRRDYEKQLGALPDWRIACCFVGKGHRRQGVATAALTGALGLIAGLGGGRVEGYPEPADAVPAGFLFNGALSTYDRVEFEHDRKIGKHRWVVVKQVESRPTRTHPTKPEVGCG